MSGSPNLLHLPSRADCANRLPHSPALPVAGAIRDPCIPFSARLVIFHKRQEKKMTYELEIQLEELRAELRDTVDGAERRQIETELESALAELAVIVAEQDGRLDAEPPF
jgi:hypothetical protein